jgi:hypothetical protein
VEDPDHPGVGDPGADFEAQPVELSSDELRGAKLPIRELRVLVEVAAPGLHTGRHGGDPLVDLVAE